MCGIIGLITRSRDEDNKFEQLMSTIRHRGPDGSHFTKTRSGDWTVYFGHHRLSIIDLASGAQPMSDENVSITFNGEIYNYRELKAQFLDSQEFRTTSDTEVILKLFRKEKNKTFAHLDGFFGMALFDSEQRSLHLARDRWGIKPLFYSQMGDGGILFGSELFPFLKINKELNVKAIHNYFFWDYAPDNMSMLQGVNKLRPAEILTWRDGGVSFSHFYEHQNLIEQNRRVQSPEDVWAEIHKTVKRSLVSDVPVGILLSGGIDSSLIAQCAFEQKGKGLPTFSIGFEESEYDESAYAKLVATHIGAEHFTKTIGENDLLERIDDILSSLDEPIADPSILPTRILCELAQQHVKVVLGGDGGDELFGGYPTYRAHGHRKWLGHIPSPLFSLLKAGVQNLKIGHGYQPLSWKLKRLVDRFDKDPLLCHFRWMSNTDLDTFSVVFKDPSGQIRLPHYEHDPSDLQLFLFLDLLNYLPSSVLTKVDRASMAVGLEARPPFLSNPFVEFAFSLPTDQKLSTRATKIILRTLAAKKLPRQIANLPKKGFAVPLRKWLQGPLAPKIEAIIVDSPLWEHLSVEGFKELWREFQSGKGDHAKTFWALLVLDHWVKRHF